MKKAKTLAIETSSSLVSVSYSEGSEVVREVESAPQLPTARIVSPSLPQLSADSSKSPLPPGFTRKRDKGQEPTKRVFPPGASTLLQPMIQELLGSVQVKPKDLDVVALTAGPGLFTGLRVAVVTAKAIAYSAGCQLVAMNTLEVLANQAFENMGNKNCEVVDVVVNAQRGHLFCARYRRAGEWKAAAVGDTQLLTRAEWIETIDDQAFVTGAGLKPFVQELETAKSAVTVVDSSLWKHSAAAVGQTAWPKVQAGEFDDFWKIQPLYFRPSSAEEKLLKAKTIS